MRVHVRVARLQFQPYPLRPVAVRPVGRVSVTVTVPLVGLLPALVTVIAYIAPYLALGEVTRMALADGQVGS